MLGLKLKTLCGQSDIFYHFAKILPPCITLIAVSSTKIPRPLFEQKWLQDFLELHLIPAFCIVSVGAVLLYP